MSDLILCTVLDRERDRESSATPDIASPSSADALSNCEAAAAALLQRAMTAHRRLVYGKTVLLEGRTASAIVAYAKKCDASAVVMDTHGKDLVERAFAGVAFLDRKRAHRQAFPEAAYAYPFET